MTRKKFLVAAAGTAATLAATTAAFGQTHGPTHGASGSAKNLLEVRGTLEHLIDQLQQDHHDFGGWRVKAIEHMQAARTDIVHAQEWDAAHPQ